LLMEAIFILKGLNSFRVVQYTFIFAVYFEFSTKRFGASRFDLSPSCYGFLNSRKKGT